MRSCLESEELEQIKADQAQGEELRDLRFMSVTIYSRLDWTMFLENTLIQAMLIEAHSRIFG